MGKVFFKLNNVADFAPGVFENTAVEGGCIQLGGPTGQHVDKGCYTSPAFSSEPFTRLLANWNADTPPETLVEMQVRIASDGRWSRWFSFGKWSPYTERFSPQEQQDDIAKTQGEYLCIQPEYTHADTVQMRIYLYSKARQHSPQVRFLSVSVDSIQEAEEQEPVVWQSRMVEVPVYSCLVRDPSISGHIPSATSLTMLANRWGEDVLPEEMARWMYDSSNSRFNNLAFLAAGGGMLGYECYARFGSLELIRKELHNGLAVGAKVRYKAPLVAESTAEETPLHKSLFELENAVADSYGHIVVVRGIHWKNGVEWVSYNDPLAQSDQTVLQEIPLAQFEKIFVGICLIFHKGDKGAGWAKPVRHLVSLELVENEIRLKAAEQNALFTPEWKKQIAHCTICYTLSDGIAYASAAQKKFYYLIPDKKGKLVFEADNTTGRKITLYAIQTKGIALVGEKVL